MRGNTGLDLSFDDDWGIKVVSVEPLPGQPGLAEGDFIVAIDGREARKRRFGGFSIIFTSFQAFCADPQCFRGNESGAIKHLRRPIGQRSGSGMFSMVHLQAVHFVIALMRSVIKHSRSGYSDLDGTC